jgi:aminoglycoside/choline kinase family phosphotransferase
MSIPHLPMGAAGGRRVSRAQLMIETLEEGLSGISGRRVQVRSIRDKEFRKSTSFTIRRIDVQLGSGETLPVIFKDLNPLRPHPKAKYVRRLELGPSRREIWMYQHVLPRLGIGTPQLYGFRWDPKQGNLWLFIEDVGPHRLCYCLDLGFYEQAAEWAARFHASTAGRSNDPRLLRFDRTHYERVGQRLRAACHERIPEHDLPIVDRALATYDEFVQRVDDLPQGMIHGELFCKNVLIRPDRATNAIAVIDWETTAIGPQYVDLVSLTAGRWSRSQRVAMRRAYFEARHSLADRPTVSPAGDDADWNRFNQEVDLVAVLQAVRWLGFWVSGDPGEAKYASRIARWIRELRLAMGEDVSS